MSATAQQKISGAPDDFRDRAQPLQHCLESLLAQSVDVGQVNFDIR